jgi:hypothetical protein
MNFRNIEGLCGSRQAKTRQGARGMSTKDIDKFVSTKIPASLKTEYVKSKKDRKSLCMLLAKFAEGRRLLRLSRFEVGEQPKNLNTPSPNKKKPSPKKNNGAGPSRPRRMNFELTNENGTPSNNNSPNKEPNYGNASASPNNVNKRARANFRANVGRLKRSEPDPFGEKMKLKGRTKAQIEAKMRRLQRTGRLPAGKTKAEIVKNMMIVRPKNVKRTAVAKPRTYSKVEQKQRQMLNFGKAKSNATGRRETKSEIVLGRQRYSPSQIRAAKREANRMYSELNLAGLAPNANNSQNEINAFKKELLNAQLAILPPRNDTKKRPSPKVSFSQIAGNSNVASEVARLNKMKNMSGSQKLKLRILKKIVKMRKNQEKRQPAVKMMTGANVNVERTSPNSVEKVNRGVLMTNQTRENLENKVQKGEASSAEKRMLTVMKALKNK